MARPARVSPDRILAAAALEFAERGFAGARVDRIARRARVNKAMLYYHFKSKDGLYRTLLRRMFTLAAGRLRAIADASAPHADKVDRVIATMAAFVDEHAFFPAIMLREVADGGAHLDRETLTALAALPAAVGGIVQQGVRARAFRDTPPMFAYFSMLAPVIFYLAGARIRKEIAHLKVVDMRESSTDDFIRHMQHATRRSLARARHARTS
ncbi:MAG: TetR/AcrR family transcriptional regulator [Acidobacteria bacterium]|nr:TetR/AcrR family transcriptional regulator [Acidobacteriota bacterium]